MGFFEFSDFFGTFERDQSGVTDNCRYEVGALVINRFATKQCGEEFDPFATVGVRLVVFRKTDSCPFQFWRIPCIHQVYRKATTTDLLELLSHLCEHYRMVEVGFYWRDDLNA